MSYRVPDWLVPTTDGEHNPFETFQ